MTTLRTAAHRECKCPLDHVDSRQSGLGSCARDNSNDLLVTVHERRTDQLRSAVFAPLTGRPAAAPADTPAAATTHTCSTVTSRTHLVTVS
ncbi:hypothetical protein BaRGS_00013513 [Batillaria attramentaria]|uniref:Uncharacterized protein n=1 Tax=Batillaria attramentaria TaxID=370345 RepID=A0ABD0L7T8_9CAEN